MNPERRKWLEEALAASSEQVEDPFKIMNKAISEINENKVSAGLDLLDYTSDFLDCAPHLEKIGGTQALFKLLSSSDGDIVRRALEVLALYLPNNPVVQLASAFRYDGLTQLFQCAARHGSCNDILYSSLSCIAGLIRGIDRLEILFIEQEGPVVLLRVFGSNNNERVLRKILSIMNSLEEKIDLSEFVESGYSKAVAPDDIQYWELLATLASRECMLPVGLKKRNEYIRGKDDFLNEFELLKSIPK